MHRPPPGQYVTLSTADEPYQAFVPAALPPQPPLAWTPALRRRFDDALVALGRLDAITALLPNAALLLYSFVRKEAVLSSQIEGTQSSLADLLLFEIDEQPGVPLDDAHEVSRYVAALERGLALLRGGLPLCSRLLCEMHAVLLDHPRGRGKAPGEVRRSAVWIGGSRPGNAAFVPPPAGRAAGVHRRFRALSQRRSGSRPRRCSRRRWRTCSSRPSTPSLTATAASGGC
jgi:Fic family protein